MVFPLLEVREIFDFSRSCQVYNKPILHGADCTRQISMMSPRTILYLGYGAQVMNVKFYLTENLRVLGQILYHFLKLGNTIVRMLVMICGSMLFV